MGSHDAATKWGLMDASNEVSYAMRHAGGERICTGARDPLPRGWRGGLCRGIDNCQGGDHGLT